VYIVEKGEWGICVTTVTSRQYWLVPGKDDAAGREDSLKRERSVSNGFYAAELVVDDGLARRVQIRFDRLKGRPATDLYDDARVHVLVDE
jgi:hypothetical protein